MKKMLIVLLMAAMAGFPLAAQEAGEESAPAGRPKSPVGVAIGEMDLHTYLVTGVTALNEEGGHNGYSGPYDGEWQLGMINQHWWENRAEVILEWNLNNMFGTVVDFRFQNWGMNSFGDSLKLPVAFGWFDSGLVKISLGKIWEGSMMEQKLLWRPDGSEGGDPPSVTLDEDHLSARIEIKPPQAPGLNFGAQMFFPNMSGTASYDGKNIADTEAWKEIAVGAEYRSDLFNVQVAVRFDSNVDTFNQADTNRSDFRSYLDSYYGSASMIPYGGYMEMPSQMGGGTTIMMAPKFKHYKEALGAMDMQTQTFGAQPAYDKGTWGYIATQIRPMANLTIQARGELKSIPAFDKFGYGKIVEYAGYSGLLGNKLSVGLTMIQEFYGKDVFIDEVVNSPFLQFEPSVSYALIPSPFPNNPIPLLGVSLSGAYGICQDVLDLFVKVHPEVEFSMGIFSLKFGYTYQYEGYMDSTGVEPKTKHQLGLELRVLY